MLKKIVNKVVRDAIYALWPELMKTLKSDVLSDLLRQVDSVLKIEPNSQYMIVVNNDDIAQQLVQALNERFTPDSRIVVLAAEDVKLIEITKRRS